jgi:ATP adenylyltransferase/5',5'''-P-1,P-4-tetraphosphate phosphorylase II
MLPYKRNDDGEVVGKCKLKGAYGGDKTQPPKQVDAQRNKLPDDFMLTSGSKVNVAVVVVPYNTGSLNGVSLRLRAVQVLELAEMQGSDDPFTSVSGGFTSSVTATPVAAVDDPFAMPVATPASNSSFVEDEIPF